MTKKQGSLNSTTNTKAIDEGYPLGNERLELPLTTNPFAVFIENFTLAPSTEPLSVISNDGAHAMKALEYIDDKSFKISPNTTNISNALHT